MQETILCSVKAQVVRPSRNKPDQGIIELFVDRLNSGNQSELDEIQALLSHLLLQDDSVLVDRRSLCILPGEFAWRLSIDLVFMTAVSSATSRLHAVSCVIRAALETTLLPSITTEQNSNPTSSNQEQYTLLVQDDIRKAHPVLTPSSARTVLVTVSLIPCSKLQEQSVVMIVDATTQEQACASGQVHVVVQLESNNHDDLSICAVQAKGKIPVGSLPEIMNTAVQVAKRDAQHTRVYKELSGVNSLLQEPFGIR
jgi:exosome complex RNA-binding protein Rrp42 (RNase PH superfamily)